VFFEKRQVDAQQVVARQVIARQVTVVPKICIAFKFLSLMFYPMAVQLFKMLSTACRDCNLTEI
jgi:hypothetical protein